MLDQLTSFLFTAGLPRRPEANSDLQSQALELLESPGRLRASWSEVMRRLADEGYEASEFALVCRIHLNLLDNCAALLEASAALSESLQLPSEKLRSVAAEVKSLQDEIHPLHALATRDPPPLDPAKLIAAQRRHAGEPAVEVGQVLRQIEAGKVKL